MSSSFPNSPSRFSHAPSADDPRGRLGESEGEAQHLGASVSTKYSARNDTRLSPNTSFAEGMDLRSSFLGSQKCEAYAKAEEDGDGTCTCTYTDLTFSQSNTFHSCSTLSSSVDFLSITGSSTPKPDLEDRRSPRGPRPPTRPGATEGPHIRTSVSICQALLNSPSNQRSAPSSHRQGRRNSAPSNYKSNDIFSIDSTAPSSSSLYPTIPEGVIGITEDHHWEAYGFFPPDDRLQRSQSADCNVAHFETAGGMSQSPPFTVTTADEWAPPNSLPTVASELSAFYQAALEEATLTEEEEEELLKRQRELVVEQPEFLNQIETAAKEDCCTLGESTAASSKNNPISQFYRAALEDSALDEAEVLSLQGQNRGKDHGQEDESDLAPAGNSSTQTEDTVSDDSPGSFYQSALEEAACAERELGLGSWGLPQDESEDCIFATETRRPSSHVLDRSFTSFGGQSLDNSLSRSALPANRTLGVRSARGETEGLTKRTDAPLSPRKEPDSTPVAKHSEVTYEYLDDENDRDLRLAIQLSKLESSSKTTKAPSNLDEKWSCTAVEESQAAPFDTDDAGGIDESVRSQQKAMEEYEQSSTSLDGCPYQKPGTPRSFSASALPREDHSASSPSLSGVRKRQPRRPSLLETRGTTETRHAISNSSSRIVRCKGCQRRLQAPVHYALVFCPKCRTISPA
ncbi:unnamed protein product [Pseudo-nitzschia multistriata]|uniref:Uncharacterized protein n=1 Tax=Pseudo-nitzschia multistriata TaxID=183589 RepID=A0A448Z0Q1_9STRA|nr:unnamed protein product [Pseudo-nitzschia multistriata]